MPVRRHCEEIERSALNMDMVNVKVNGIAVSVPKGSTLSLIHI